MVLIIDVNLCVRLACNLINEALKADGAPGREANAADEDSLRLAAAFIGDNVAHIMRQPYSCQHPDAHPESAQDEMRNRLTTCAPLYELQSSVTKVLRASPDMKAAGKAELKVEAARIRQSCAILDETFARVYPSLKPTLEPLPPRMALSKRATV